MPFILGLLVVLALLQMLNIIALTPLIWSVLVIAAVLFVVFAGDRFSRLP